MKLHIYFDCGNGWMSKYGLIQRGQGVWAPTSRKPQVAIGLLRNIGMDFLGPIVSQGRFVRPSVKYVDN